MQECLCVLVVDASEEVSASAQEFLDYLFSLSGKIHFEDDIAEIFSRFVLCCLILDRVLGCFWTCLLKGILLALYFDCKTRLIEKLPKVVLGREESLALSHAQQLLVVMYYSGPQLVVDQLLRSPVCGY